MILKIHPLIKNELIENIIKNDNKSQNLHLPD